MNGVKCSSHGSCTSLLNMDYFIYIAALIFLKNHSSKWLPFFTLLVKSLGPSPQSSKPCEQTYPCCRVCLVWLSLGAWEIPYKSWWGTSPSQCSGAADLRGGGHSTPRTWWWRTSWTTTCMRWPGSPTRTLLQIEERGWGVGGGQEGEEGGGGEVSPGPGKNETCQLYGYNTQYFGSATK